MAPNFDEPIDCLPLIPEDVLKKHACHEPLDTRFRSAARLLQSIWRTDRGLPIGSYVGEDGKRKLLGSRVSVAAGRAGGNFLTAEIAHVARRESIYRELGAMIDEDRLFTNLLSSTAMVVNVIGPLKLELAQATCVLHELIPSFAGTATQVLFEHSPGRGNPRFLGDYTAFDALIRYRTPEGRYGFVAIEAKLSEGMSEPAPRHRDRYDEIADTCGLFADPTDAALRAPGLNQLCREQMLAQRLVDLGPYDEGYFMLLGPALNYHVQQAAETYQSLLAPPEDRKVRFLNITLEQMIAVIRLCDSVHADALHRRYCDWWLVDGEIELAAPAFGSIAKPIVRKAATGADTPEPEKMTRKKRVSV
jgi:hypothetical protein